MNDLLKPRFSDPCSEIVDENDLLREQRDSLRRTVVRTNARVRLMREALEQIGYVGRGAGSPGAAKMVEIANDCLRQRALGLREDGKLD